MLVEAKPTCDEVVAMHVNPYAIVGVAEYENTYYMTTSDGSNTEITRESYDHIVEWMEEED